MTNQWIRWNVSVSKATDAGWSAAASRQNLLLDAILTDSGLRWPIFGRVSRCNTCHVARKALHMLPSSSFCSLIITESEISLERELCRSCVFWSFRSLVLEEFVLLGYVATWVYNQIQTFRDDVVILSLGFGQSDYLVQQLDVPEKWNPQFWRFGITTWFIQIDLLVPRKWNQPDSDLMGKQGLIRNCQLLFLESRNLRDLKVQNGWS
jgi:hypothetical protein